MIAETAERQHKSVLARAGVAAAWAVACGIILAFFIRFVVPGYQAHFAMDDPMNFDYYWSPGPWRLIRGLVLFFSTYERPMGGVFYMVIYRFFGLNPLPYHIVVDALILVNCFLAYRFVRLLSGSPLAGALTALLLTYHRALTWLIYRPSFIYDTLCFTFFFLTLNYYIAIRRTGEALTKKQAAIVILLYICALDSKEMAVSLPLVVLAYEAIWYPPQWRSWWSIRRWLRGEALPALILGVITAVYVIGHTAGPGAITKYPAYRPVLSMRNFAQSNARFVNELFYREADLLSQRQCALIWAALLYLAWRRREKHLAFAAFFVLLTPLPIDFVPGRGGSCLYIPMAGWALALSTLFLALAALVKNEPPFRRVPLSVIRAAFAVAAAVVLWGVDDWEGRDAGPAMIAGSQLTWTSIQQLKALQPSVKPNTRILFLKDPFGVWDMKFIADLLYNDHSVMVQLANQNPVTPAQMPSFDIIFIWEQGHLVRLKPLPVVTAPAS